MKWEDREESENVEDERGSGGGGGAGMGLAAFGGGGSILLIIVCMILKIDPQQVANVVGNGQGGAPPVQRGPADPAQDKVAHFTKVIFGDTERIWGAIFQKLNKEYPKPVLHLFSGEVQTACGGADAAVGPFYCPGDQKVYIDLDFYNDMETKLHAPGDFARAYVVAHEVGHHVQRLLYPRDIATVESARRTGDPKAGNRMSVRLELQADYLAGVWAHYGQQEWRFIDPGDIDAVLNAASQIGDDRLQKQAGRRVVPDSFTHGTSAQRIKWFKKGFETGSLNGGEALFTTPYESL